MLIQLATNQEARSDQGLSGFVSHRHSKTAASEAAVKLEQ